MALSSLLSIARTALTTHQRAVELTGHNIANASTEGYTRQRTRLQAETPLRTPQGFVGRGVTIDAIERPRNRLLDAAVRREQGGLSQFSTLRDTLGEVEDAFGEPSETGVAAALDGFWNAWADLANHPTSGSARVAVRARGGEIARLVTGLDARLDAVRARSVEQLTDHVRQVNDITVQIAELNRQLQSAGGGERSAADLQDRRDLLIDELAGLLQVQVSQEERGSVRVFGGDQLLVDAAYARSLAVSTDSNGRPTVVGSDNNQPLNITTGTLAAHADVLHNALPDIRTRLDTLVREIVGQVNTLHATGETLSGVPATEFFRSTGTTAATMALSAPIAASHDNVAAGTGSGPGDNSVALAIAALRDTRLAGLSNVTPGDYYGAVTTTVGQEVREAGGLATAQDALLASVQQRRDSEIGVSLDEELVNLITNQQAYAAATRLVTVADEMIQDVLRMV